MGVFRLLPSSCWIDSLCNLDRQSAFKSKISWQRCFDRRFVADYSRGYSYSLVLYIIYSCYDVCCRTNVDVLDGFAVHYFFYKLWKVDNKMGL